jgi:TPR repeat protein
MFNLGVVLWKQGKEDQAVQWYRKAADAGNADAMFTLGALLAEQGEEN